MAGGHMRQSARPCADRSPGEESGTSPPTSQPPLHGLPPLLPPETGLKCGDSDPSPETGGRSARESRDRQRLLLTRRAGRPARGSRKQGLHTLQEEGPPVLSRPWAGRSHIRPPSRALPEHPARVGRWHVVSGLDPCSMPGRLGQEGPMGVHVPSSCPGRGESSIRQRGVGDGSRPRSPRPGYCTVRGVGWACRPQQESGQREGGRPQPLGPERIWPSPARPLQERRPVSSAPGLGERGLSSGQPASGCSSGSDM